MKRVDSRSLYRVINNLGRMNGLYRDESSEVNQAKEEILTADDKETVRALLKGVRDSSKTLGTNVTVTAAEDALARLRKPINYKDMGDEIKIVDEIFRKEIRSSCIFSISSDCAKLLDPEADHFGSDFAKRFPSASFDVQEACTCLALARDTACVFHLMRAMEIVLRALHACLGLPDPTGSDRNWGNMLAAMKTEMNSRNQNSNGGWTGDDRELFTELYASFDAVRAAWRNTTMHIERRYGRDEANHLFVVIKEFAKKVAARINENGEPLA